MHIGQSKVATGMVVGKFFVIKAQAVEHGGLKVVDVDGIFHDVESEFVGLTDRHARPNSATGHPHRISLRVVVSPERPS